MFKNKIVLASRITKDSFDECIKDFGNRFKNNQSIKKIFIICDLQKQLLSKNNVEYEIIFDTKPTRQTALNLVIDKLNKDKNNKFHLLAFSKEVELQNKNIDEMIKVINSNDNLIVAGYRLKDNILNNNEKKLYSNGDLQNRDMGIAYQVPWNTCALWNKKFVYGKNKEKLRFDEICEKDKNQLGNFEVKINNELMNTNYEGMEDGLAIAELVTNNKGLKYQLLKGDLNWNIIGNEEATKKHKIKMARKNIVLSTFMNIKGYSVNKLRESALNA